MMNRFLGILLLILLVCFKLKADIPVDSLYYYLATSKEDHAKYHYHLYNHFASVLPAEADKHLSQIISIQQSDEDPYADLYLAIINSSKMRTEGLLDSSIIYSQLWLNHATALTDYVYQIQAHRRIADLNIRQTDFDQAIQHLIEAKHIAGVHNDSTEWYTTQSMMGRVYYLYGDYEQAIHVIKSCLQNLSKQAVDDELEEERSRLYNNLAILYKEEGIVDSAIRYNQLSLEISQRLGDVASIASSFKNLGNLYLKALDFVDSEIAFLKAINLKQELGTETASSEIGLAQCYFYSNRIPEAVELVQKNRKEINEVTDAQTKINLLSILAASFEINNQFDSAYYFMRQIRDIEKQRAEEKYPEALKKLKAKAEVALKNQEIAFLEEKSAILAKEKQLVIVAAILVLFLLMALGLLFYQRYRTKEEIRAINLEQRLLQAQMDPHFIFNALAIVQSFIFDHEPHQAGRFLAKFAKLMRIMLENSRQPIILLSKEIEAIELYLQVQQMRFNDAFQFSIEVDEALEPNELEMAPMYIQPLLENAIEHGVQHLKEPGCIEVKIEPVNQALQITILDNGIGREASAKINQNKRKNHQSQATQITIERLAKLRKDQTTGIQISDYKHPTTGTGTQVVLTVPLIHVS